ncbi:formimidoylglutamate deiminase [Chelativorans sp. M5D2P16]|uniref:formimidoylglutamate deiminase n=1 Tax=Chelativorans sp. M5D2P16 TaxID=3095678 RepID=UPI002ACA9B8C|nr:formimidoylglutamate deiminase [Chelativorans sp. M5D2P16]MDZ5697269.1 formimidoylglutamate deiminase [Chelativorans sp. M5D2P16]
MQEIFARTALTPAGWQDDVRVTIGADGRIAAVEAGAAPASAYRVPVLLPALSNLHSHTFQRAMAGLAERRGQKGRDSFWTWRQTMYRFLDRLSPEDIEAIAAFAFMEMQEAGFCAVAEFHYLHHQPGGGAHADIAELAARIADAAGETGIGLTLLPVLYRYGGADRRPLADGQLRFGNDMAAFERLMAGAQGHLAHLPADTVLGAAAHSLRAATAEEIRTVSALRPEAPFHIHIAEQGPEVEEILAAFGARPVEYLLGEAVVDRRWCLIHATHMNAVETRELARTGAVAGLCPITEANLGDGVFNGSAFRRAGGMLGVGSDSNVRISVPEELRQLEYSQRLKDRARTVLAEPGASCGRALYDTALAGGARALGRESGALETGRWADLVALDPAAFAGLASGDAILDGWIFAGGNEAVTDLWSAGRHSVQGGRHVAREAIAGRYRARLEKIVVGL